MESTKKTKKTEKSEPKTSTKKRLAENFKTPIASVQEKRKIPDKTENYEVNKQKSMEIKKDEEDISKYEQNTINMDTDDRDNNLKMKLFVCRDHATPHPFPPASIIMSYDENNAAVLLTDELKRNGIRFNSEDKPPTMIEIKLTPEAYIINFDSLENPKYSDSFLDSELNIYISKNHHAIFPLQPASIIIARDEDHAKLLLDKKLMSVKSKPFKEHRYSIESLSFKPQVHIISLGESVN